MVAVAMPEDVGKGVVAGQARQQVRPLRLLAVSGMKPDRDRVPAAHVERVRYLSRLGLGPSHEQVAAETLRLVVVHAPVAPARRRRQRLCRRAPVKVGKIDWIGAVAPVAEEVLPYEAALSHGASPPACRS